MGWELFMSNRTSSLLVEPIDARADVVEHRAVPAVAAGVLFQRRPRAFGGEVLVRGFGHTHGASLIVGGVEDVKGLALRGVEWGELVRFEDGHRDEGAVDG